MPRTREEIEFAYSEAWDVKAPAATMSTENGLMLEVLLDIRDLLTPPKARPLNEVLKDAGL